VLEGKGARASPHTQRWTCTRALQGKSTTHRSQECLCLQVGKVLGQSGGSLLVCIICGDKDSALKLGRHGLNSVGRGGDVFVRVQQCLDIRVATCSRRDRGVEALRVGGGVGALTWAVQWGRATPIATNPPLIQQSIRRLTVARIFAVEAGQVDLVGGGHEDRVDDVDQGQRRPGAVTCVRND